MKARPRSVENRVAEELTLQLRELGYGVTLKRVPAPGYPWPDLTWPNDLNLAVEVKSRKSTPQLPTVTSIGGGYWYVPMESLSTPAPTENVYVDVNSRTIEGWMEHLIDTVGYHALPMLVCHRPGQAILKAVCIFPMKTARMLWRLDDE